MAAGALFAAIASSALRYELEAPEIRAYCEGTYPCRVVPGKRLFTTPVSQGYADAVTAQLKRKIEREGVKSRYENAYPVTATLISGLGFFFDLINLLFVVVFAGIAALMYRPLRRLFTPNSPIH